MASGILLNHNGIVIRPGGVALGASGDNCCCNSTMYMKARLCVAEAVVDVGMTVADAASYTSAFYVTAASPKVCYHFNFADAPVSTAPGTLLTPAVVTALSTCTDALCQAADFCTGCAATQPPCTISGSGGAYCQNASTHQCEVDGTLNATGPSSGSCIWQWSQLCSDGSTVAFNLQLFAGLWYATVTRGIGLYSNTAFPNGPVCVNGILTGAIGLAGVGLCTGISVSVVL